MKSIYKNFIFLVQCIECFLVQNSLAMESTQKPISAFASQIRKVASKNDPNISAFGHSSFKDAPQEYFTFNCSDRKLVLGLTAENAKKIAHLKKDSLLIKDMIADGICANKELSFPSISSADTEKLLFLLTKLHHQKELDEKLYNLSQKELVNVIKTTNYLNIPKLIENASAAAAAKFDKKINSLTTLADLEKEIAAWEQLGIEYDVQAKIVEKIIFPKREKLVTNEVLGEGSKAVAFSVSITPDGTKAISGSDDRSVRVWNLKTNTQDALLTGHTKWVRSVAITSDGTKAISGSDDGSVRIWNLTTNTQDVLLTGHTEWVLSVAITPDGKKGISGSEDRSVRVWNLKTNTQDALLTGHTKWVRSVAITPDGTKAISGSDDESVRVWNLKTNTQEALLTGHTEWVRSVAITSDGTKAISGSNDKSVRVWNLKTNTQEALLTVYTAWVRSVAITSDGTKAISGDKSVRVWNLKTNTQEALLTGHTTYVESIAITPDGTRMISAGDCGSVRVWDLQWLFNSPKITLDQALLISFLLKNAHTDKSYDLKQFPKLKESFELLPEDLKKLNRKTSEDSSKMSAALKNQN